MVDFRRDVLRLAKGKLRDVGFTIQRDLVQKMLLRDGWYGWIGLNHALHPGVIDILTITGIRCEAVEQLVHALLPTASVYWGPSFTRPLYMLVPHRKEPTWSFTELNPILLEDMIDKVMTYGLPFMKDLASLDALLRAFERPIYSTPDVKTRLPCVLYLVGRRAEAESYIASQLSTLRATLPEAALLAKPGMFSNYEVFAANFQAMCVVRLERVLSI